jgi:hypothetical protein
MVLLFGEHTNKLSSKRALFSAFTAQVMRLFCTNKRRFFITMCGFLHTVVVLHTVVFY